MSELHRDLQEAQDHLSLGPRAAGQCCCQGASEWLPRDGAFRPDGHFGMEPRDPNSWHVQSRKPRYTSASGPRSCTCLCASSGWGRWGRMRCRLRASCGDRAWGLLAALPAATLSWPGTEGRGERRDQRPHNGMGYVLVKSSSLLFRLFL